MKKTVLIFGISSFVGSNLGSFMKNDYRVIGTYYQNPVVIPGVTCLPCDVLRKDLVSNLIRIFKPDIVIYAIGMSSLTECRLNPKLADALNTAGAVNCCVASERQGSLYVYISSAFVFGGEDHLSREGDTPLPITNYGQIVSTSEFFIQRSSLYYLILRCSPLLGRSYSNRHENWFESVQYAFAQHKQVEADDSVVSGFLDIYVMYKILHSLLEKNIINRLLHVSSSDYMTRYELARQYASIFKKDASLVHKVNGAFPVDPAKLNRIKAGAFYFKLDTSNLEQILGTGMPKILDSLQLIHKRLHPLAG